MIAKDIMSKKPDYLPPTANLSEAAKKMANSDYGFIPVGENDRLIGTVTDRDIVIRAIAEGKDPNSTTLREVMSEGIEYCFENDSVEKVAQHMEEHQIRRLVVLNEDKRLTGIISVGDIATKFNNDKVRSELIDAVSED